MVNMHALMSCSALILAVVDAADGLIVTTEMIDAIEAAVFAASLPAPVCCALTVSTIDMPRSEGQTDMDPGKVIISAVSVV